MTSPRMRGRRIPMGGIPHYFPLSLEAGVRARNGTTVRLFQGVTTGLSQAYAKVALDCEYPAAEFDWVGAHLKIRVHWPAVREQGVPAELVILGRCVGFEEQVLVVSIE